MLAAARQLAKAPPSEEVCGLGRAPGCPSPLGRGDCLGQTDGSVPGTFVHLKLCRISRNSPGKQPEKIGEAWGMEGRRPEALQFRA